MSDPCQQEHKIGSIEATLKAMSETMRDLKHILEVIASQGTTIKKLEQDTETLYARVRKVELNAVEHGVKIAGAAGLFSLVITAISTFLLNHFGRH